MLPEAHSPVREFTKGEKTQTVGVIVVAGIKDLLVESCSVETSPLCKADIIFKSRIIRCGPESILVEALIKDHAEKDGLVIEVESFVFNMELTQACIRKDFITQLAAAVKNFILDVVEERGFRGPEPGLIKSNGQMDSRGNKSFCRSDFFFILKKGHFESAFPGEGAEFRGEMEGPVIHIGGDPAAGETQGVAALDENIAPDAGGAGVGTLF